SNTVASHGDDIPLPTGKDHIEYEAELAVVIGKQARNVSPENASEYIAGYTCLNDISNRDDQQKEQNWVRGKSFDSAAPMGPVLIPPEELPTDATIQCRINGDV
ncbi:MAG: fumarylacetoacetate hydrolase family protein, partial [Halobacteriaceae archaeon]